MEMYFHVVYKELLLRPVHVLGYRGICFFALPVRGKCYHLQSFPILCNALLFINRVSSSILFLMKIKNDVLIYCVLHESMFTLWQSACCLPDQKNRLYIKQEVSGPHPSPEKLFQYTNLCKVMIIYNIDKENINHDLLLEN